MDDKTELAPGEPHPSAREALNYLQGLPVAELMRTMEAMASCAIEGNRLAEVCVGTLDRLLTGKPVSDRYVLGLAWSIKAMDEQD